MSFPLLTNMLPAPLNNLCCFLYVARLVKKFEHDVPFMNHETQLDLLLAGSERSRLAVEIKFYNSFEVITGFPRLFNLRTRFKAQFHAIKSLVEKTFQTANKQRAR